MGGGLSNADDNQMLPWSAESSLQHIQKLLYASPAEFAVSVATPNTTRSSNNQNQPGLSNASLFPIHMPLELLVVTVGGLIASFINAAFATGGIYIVLASSSFIFPLAVAIPLQSAFAFASLAARIVYFKSYIYWPIVILFVIGSVVGVSIGSSVFVALPEATIALSLGVFLLLLIWMPSFSNSPAVQGSDAKGLDANRSDVNNSYSKSSYSKSYRAHR